MTERDIKGWITVLTGAMQRDDEKEGVKAVMKLLEGALTDLHRIADAVEILAKRPT